MRPDQFYVGVDTHMIGVDFPIMVSDLRLKRRKSLKSAAAPVMIDSGSFTIHDSGQSFDPPAVYVERIRRYQVEVGQVARVATYGRMCEPYILAKTGSTVERNQALTIESYLTLVHLAPDVPWMPELQGWALDDYHRHFDLYVEAGVDLAALPVVGVGSICRREGTLEARQIVASVAARGVSVHGFGVKSPQTLGPDFVSADSFAWSYGARKRTGRCPHGIVVWEANCPEYLRAWRERILKRIADRGARVVVGRRGMEAGVLPGRERGRVQGARGGVATAVP